MATVEEFPIEVQSAAAPTRELLRRASQELHQENPYVKMVDRGAAYLPPESANAVGAEEAKDLKPSYGSDDENGASTEAGGSTAGELVSHPSVDVEEDTKEKRNIAKRAHSIILESAVGDWTPSVVWHAIIHPDTFENPKHMKDGKLKPRRPVPQMLASEFLEGLKPHPMEPGTFIFEGAMNGWPALSGLVLASITLKQGTMMSSQIVRVWNAEDKKPLPAASAITKTVRARFLAPAWTSIGWKADSPGFVFWFSEQHGGVPRLLSGASSLKQLDRDEEEIRLAHITQVHCYAHRYPVVPEAETISDRQTYHTLMLVEWSHGKFTTVIESAFLNAVGGFGGKANWCEDKLSSSTKLSQCLLPGMMQPWDVHKSEIRMYDMPFKTPKEFEAYLDKYSDPKLPLVERRFLDWQKYASGFCKLRNCTASSLMGYLLNYIQRVWGYDGLILNCQTFGVDLLGFLTGSKNVSPYSMIVRTGYRQHVMSFMYMPSESTA